MSKKRWRKKNKKRGEVIYKRVFTVKSKKRNGYARKPNINNKIKEKKVDEKKCVKIMKKMGHDGL